MLDSLISILPDILMYLMIYLVISAGLVYLCAGWIEEKTGISLFDYTWDDKKRDMKVYLPSYIHGILLWPVYMSAYLIGHIVGKIKSLRK